MNAAQMRSPLDDLGLVRHPCDLDVLVFFSRYPRALLTSEQLGAFVGYDLKHIVKSLDRLIDAGLLERSQDPTHPARLYVLTLDRPHGESLSSLVTIASTRQGRQELLQLLESGSPQARDGLAMIAATRPSHPHDRSVAQRFARTGLARRAHRSATTEETGDGSDRYRS